MSPVSRDKGEVTIILSNVELQLRFKTKNMRVLSELTGHGPLGFVQQFQPVDESDEAVAMRFADPRFIVPVLAAGCAHHQEYSKQSIQTLQDNLEEMIDNEIERSGKSPAEVYVALGAQLLLPLSCAIQGISEVDGKSVGNLVAEMRDALAADRAKSSAGGSSPSEQPLQE